MANNNNSNVGRRLASAIARAAKGAASGGIYGAAIGVAREFAPEILKTLGIIIAILIFLPVLTFAALPNIIFGFESSDKPELVEFTSLAEGLSTEYGAVDGYAEERADGIVAAILEFLDANGEDDYDEMEVTRDFDNLSEEWFIAISSVAHEQDLFTMNGDTVYEMTSLKMDSKWDIISNALSSDGGSTIARLLKIDVYDITPEELMDRLDFTDEQRNWAEVLHSSLVQDQNLTRAYGDAYYGTDYGDIVFTDSEIEVVYYNQTDSRWGGKAYGTSTIASAGCGPTALAIATATFVDSSVTPEDIATWGYDYYVKNKGSKHLLITEGGAHYGLTVTGLGANAQKVVDALGRGHLVIAIMSKGHFTDGGHFIVLRGMTSDGKILVADPASITRSNQEWSLRLIVNELNRNAGADGPFWEVSG